MLYIWHTRPLITSVQIKNKDSERGMGNVITKANLSHAIKIQPSSVSSTESRQTGWASVHVVCNLGHHMIIK